jgi:hypothetical protein
MAAPKGARPDTVAKIARVTARVNKGQTITEACKAERVTRGTYNAHSGRPKAKKYSAEHMAKLAAIGREKAARVKERMAKGETQAKACRAETISESNFRKYKNESAVISIEPRMVAMAPAKFPVATLDVTKNRRIFKPVATERVMAFVGPANAITEILRGITL